MKSLCVEGWRDINHSFSLLNQWQLLQFLEEDFNLYHRDMPFLKGSWNRKTNGSGLSKKQKDQISSIASPSEEQIFDVIYRINFPFNLAEGNANKIYVFGAPSFGHCKGKIVGASPKEACERGNLEIITCSKWSKMAFLNSGFSEEKIKVIPLGVQPSSYYPIESNRRKEFRQKLGFNEDDFILLNVGALTPNKGIDLILNAYCDLKSSFPRIKLIIKDSSNLYDRTLTDIVKKIIGKKKNNIDYNLLSDVINISQNLDINGMKSLYNISDAYISPYLAEGFNLPPLEAAACGVPILVTAGGATDEYYSKEIGLQISSKKQIDQNGNIYMLPEYESLIMGIKSLLQSKKSFDHKSCSKYVHKNFNWELTSRSLLKQFGFSKRD